MSTAWLRQVQALCVAATELGAAKQRYICSEAATNLAGTDDFFIHEIILNAFNRAADELAAEVPSSTLLERPEK